MGDSHARNIAKELLYNHGQQFQVIGLVKLGSRLEDTILHTHNEI
jgi:hypothetical protein